MLYHSLLVYTYITYIRIILLHIFFYIRKTIEVNHGNDLIVSKDRKPHEIALAEESIVAD